MVIYQSPSILEDNLDRFLQSFSAQHSKDRSHTFLSIDAASSLTQIFTQPYQQFAILQRANIGWHEAHHGQGFTRSYTAITPGQWTEQLISQNLLLAIAGHLQISSSRSNIHYSSRPQSLISTAINPRLARPTFALLSIYRFTSIHSTS
jgi:hypothetical protein